MPCVLDLNAVRSALQGHNPRGQKDSTVWDLMNAIERTCDKLFVTQQLGFRYFALRDEFLSTGGPAELVVSFYRYFNSWIIRGKVSWVGLETCPEIPQDSQVKDEDVPLIRICLGYGASLATYDEPLILIGKRNGWRISEPVFVIPQLVSRRNESSRSE